MKLEGKFWRENFGEKILAENFGEKILAGNFGGKNIYLALILVFGPNKLGKNLE